MVYIKSKKKLVCIFFLLSVLVFLVVFLSPPKQIKLHSESAAVLSIDGHEVMFDKNMNKRLKPASMTKLMSMLLIFEKIEAGRLTYDEKVLISKNAVDTPASKAGLIEGERLSVDTLLKCVFLPSGSDAVIALAEHVYGTEDNFTEQMNKKARELSLENTQFKNCVGLDADGHFSSAYDTAVVARELVTRFPRVYDYTSLPSAAIEHEDGSTSFITNTNPMLIYEGVDGLKTGSLPASSYSLTFTYNRDNKHLIFVVMSSIDPSLRMLDCEALLKAYK